MRQKILSYIKCLRKYSESVLATCAEKCWKIFVTNGWTSKYEVSIQCCKLLLNICMDNPHQLTSRLLRCVTLQKIIDVEACYTPVDCFITLNKKCHARSKKDNLFNSPINTFSYVVFCFIWFAVNL